MSLAAKLITVSPRDLTTVQVLTSQPVDPDNEWEGYAWLPSGPPLRVYSEKIGAAEAFREGKTDTNVNFTLYADYRRSQPLPLSEKSQIWHPEFSLRNEDGTPDYSDRLLDVQSVRVIRPDMVIEIQAGGSY
jgi:hypothetical protein